MAAFSIANKEIVIFGLGQHGGGVAAAVWCARHGARVTVYDQKPLSALPSARAQLKRLPITFQCGVDNPYAIRKADIVIKNPAVPRTNPLLHEARRIESDLSLLLYHQLPTTIAVTGTKGKSSTTSALDHALSHYKIAHRTAGNIGVSIFSSIDILPQISYLLLELSSFQLGDLEFSREFNRERGVDIPDRLPHWPDVAICTNIYPDHLDYYATMEEYMRDKYIITAHQSDEQWLILNGERGQEQFRYGAAEQSSAQLLLVGREIIKSNTDRAAATMQIIEQDGKYRAQYDNGREQAYYDLKTSALGEHHLYNLSYAYAALRSAKVDIGGTEDALFRAWHGLPHRMELVGEKNSIRFINDSAATIPDATRNTIAGIDAQIYLIAGGSDKKIDLQPFVDIATRVHTIALLEGSATERIVLLFNEQQIAYRGPFSSLRDAFNALLADIEAGERQSARAETAATQERVLLLSPGCSSFGMFQHEFDRGEQYRALAQEYLYGSDD